MHRKKEVSNEKGRKAPSKPRGRTPFDEDTEGDDEPLRSRLRSSGATPALRSRRPSSSAIAPVLSPFNNLGVGEPSSRCPLHVAFNTAYIALAVHPQLLRADTTITVSHLM